jgi:hypothetical protein
MTVYHVYEVQEEIHCRKWCYTIEATDADEALERVQDGKSENSFPVGELGDPNYGSSGWAVRAVDASDDGHNLCDDPWDDAFNNMIENLA